jgi:hypothetical protein
MDYLRVAYNIAFWCKRKISKYVYNEITETHRVSVSDIPWLWIGVTTSDNINFSVTEEINNSINYGSVVDIAYLEDITGITDGISWKYLDPVELVEKNFPSNGFVIEDDSTK